MATYKELFDLKQDSTLLNKITTSVAIKAKSVIGTGNAGQKDWSRDAIKNPNATAKSIIWFILVANKDATVAQINSATDGAIQTNTDAAIDDLISSLT